MHTPVLLQEVIEGLRIKPGGKYIDATVGEGGHMQEMLKKGALVLGLDRDRIQIDHLKRINDPSLTLVCANFANIVTIARENGFDKADGILFDLGLSWSQLSARGKGLSYRKMEDPLDMRLDEANDITAENVLNTYSEDELYDVFARFSEEVRAREIAEAIVSYRKLKRYRKVRDLNMTIEKVMGSNAGKTYSRIYQALRIMVNKEFDNLKKGLDGARSLINPQGRIAVISFHSLEDRIVKQFIRERGLKQITKKAIKGDRELPFERSAHLRIFSP